MGNLIFLIIIIIVLRNVIEKAKSDPGKGSNQHTGSHSWNGGLTKAGSLDVKENLSSAASKAASQIAKHGATASEDKATARKSTAAGGSHSMSRTSSSAKNTGTAKGSSRSDGAAKEQESEQISTTEYLRQKALEDQKEHEEAARLEAMRLHRETGGRRAAQRHYDGDSVPKGMRIVKCGYCGAENLIGDHQNQKDFTCYFCREIL